ncbi:MAG: DegT/DnrJ/EryC1/StrS family aminotransferase [Lentisphaeria bacterium]|nr:DegT/DnrJ/EryC1/StrS family aminotransferase [Lentisphaeria bacterium]
MNYRYPCTGLIPIRGFGAFLEEQIGSPRQNIRLFADELRRKYGFPYMTLVNSGSSANLVAAMAMAEKLRNAGKPLTAAISALTFPTTVSAMILAGFEVRIIDTEPGGFTMSPDLLEQEIAGISLIVPTHLLGFPADMARIGDIARGHGCLVLQDACEAMELLDPRQRPYYDYGDMTTLSFYHPHHLSSYGGGAVVTLNSEDAMLADSICHWGRACKCHIDPALCTVPHGPAHQFTYERTGLNAEISELNACFGRWRLRTFDEQERHRKENYDILFRRLSGVPALKAYPHPEIGGSLFVFPLTLLNGMTVRDAYERLLPVGVEIRTLMGGVCNEQAAFAGLDRRRFRNAHDMAEHSFFVGIHQTIPHDDARAMAELLADTLR